MINSNASFHFFELLKGICRSSNQVLDLGCSSGSMDFGTDSVGVVRIALDCDLSLLKKNNSFKNRIAADLYHLPFRETQFDFIVFKYVLEHLRYPELAVASLNSITKKNQFVYVVVPKYYAFQDTLYRFLGKTAELLGCGKQAHIQKFTFGSLCRLFYSNGFVMVDFFEADAGLSFLDRSRARKTLKGFIKLFLKFVQVLFGKNLLERNEMHFIFCKFD